MKLEVYDNKVLRKTEYSFGSEGYNAIKEKTDVLGIFDSFPLTLGESVDGELAAYFKDGNSKYVKNLKTVTASDALGYFISLKFNPDGTNIRTKVYHYGNTHNIDIGKNIVLTGQYDESDEITVYHMANNMPMTRDEVLQHISSVPFVGVTLDKDGNVLRTSEYFQKPIW